MDIQDAIDCARIYDNASENICYESGGVNPITPEVAKELQDRGHEVTDKGEWQLFFGGVQGISIGKDGTLRGGCLLYTSDIIFGCLRLRRFQHNNYRSGCRNHSSSFRRNYSSRCCN